MPARPRQFAHPRVAEMVAAELRSRIVSGALRDGEMLPKQDDLLLEFPVGRPSIREAMRILETEGLISVRRGNVGGAEVHAPSAETVAFTFGLVMQSLHVTVEDLSTAFRIIEPKCAALCASRPDRATEVVPVLRQLNEEMTGAARHAEYMRQATRYHAAVVELCGNTTIRLVMHALEALWAAQSLEPPHEALTEYDDEAKTRMYEIHERITAAIEAGDGEAADSLLLHHMEKSQASSREAHGAATVTVTGQTRSWPQRALKE